MKNPCKRKCWGCGNVAMHADDITLATGNVVRFIIGTGAALSGVIDSVEPLIITTVKRDVSAKTAVERGMQRAKRGEKWEGGDK